MQDELNPVAWMPISSAPKDEEILAAIQVRHKDGRTWWERHVIVIDSETSTICDMDFHHGWEAFDYEVWQPLPPTPDAHPPTTNPVDDRQPGFHDHQMVEAVALAICKADGECPCTTSCHKPEDIFHTYAQAALTAARAQDRNEIEAWQVAAETWQQNFQDASCENQRLRETLERIEKFKAWGSPKYALAELRQFARQALAAGEHRKDAP